MRSHNCCHSGCVKMDVFAYDLFQSYMKQKCAYITPYSETNDVCQLDRHVNKKQVNDLISCMQNAS